MCVVEPSTGKERLFFGVDSASTAAAILDVACDYDPPVDLILAADKISKAQIGKCQNGEWGVRVQNLCPVRFISSSWKSVF